MSHFIRGTAAALAVALVVGPSIHGLAAEPAPAALSQATYRALHTLIRPHDHEWRHLRVQWLTDVVAVRRKAAEEDKPIVICYTGGAGYNEPLGTC
jgi:hypothetical protein